MNRLKFLNLLHKYGLVLIFITLLFLRFYKMEVLNPFGWDQVDNAWAAQNMIVNHKFPLLGMVAKQNSGIYQRSQKVFKVIEKGEEIGFQEGVSESYLYYYYMRKKGKEVY